MKKAFTLVETLFVILVFGTGILAVLYGMTQTLGQSDRAKTQITSSFLAREGIELMYNLRDSNYRKKLPRNCLFQRVEGMPTLTFENGKESKNPYCLEYFTGGMVLQLAIGSGKNYLLVRTGTVDENDFEKTFETFQLFYQTWAENRFSFTYTWFGGQPLRYARYLTIEQIKDENAVLPSDKLLKISSHVLFKKSGLTGDTVMESFIWNYDIGW